MSNTYKNVFETVYNGYFLVLDKKMSEGIDNVIKNILEHRLMKHMKILKCKELTKNLVIRLMNHLPDVKINEKINCTSVMIEN